MNTLIDTPSCRYLIEPILDTLEKIKSNAGSSSIFKYVEVVLQQISEFDEHLPYDPLTEVLMALYDAMAFKDKYLEYSSMQYKKAYEIIDELSKNLKPSRDIVEKAIGNLDDIGFDILPYSCE